MQAIALAVALLLAGRNQAAGLLEPQLVNRPGRGRAPSGRANDRLAQ